MSILCSDSDDGAAQDQVTLHCKAYLSGWKSPNPCFLSPSPALRITRKKLRPLRANSLAARKPGPFKAEAKYTESNSGNFTGKNKIKGSPSLEKIEVLNPSTQKPQTNFDGVQYDSVEPRMNEHTKVNNELIPITAPLKSGAEGSSSVQTNTQAVYGSPQKTYSCKSPSHESISTIRRSIATSPVMRSPRKKRKKPQSPLPPYGRLLKDIPDDDIATYSSDDADAIRSKSSLMMQNLRQVQLENYFDKTEEIEKWRRESTCEL